jgi:PilZ domain
VLLEELPAKTIHALLRSITWTEVDVAFPRKNPFRRIFSHLPRPNRWVARGRKTGLDPPGTDDGSTTRRSDHPGWAPPIEPPLTRDRDRFASRNEGVSIMEKRWQGKDGRWGDRVRVDIPVRVSVNAIADAGARLKNLSLSGAFVKADVDLGLHAQIQVSIRMPLPSQRAAQITAFVSRKTKEGVGVEWCEFAPSVVKDLLRSPSIPLPG